MILGMAIHIADQQVKQGEFQHEEPGNGRIGGFVQKVANGLRIKAPPCDAIRIKKDTIVDMG